MNEALNHYISQLDKGEQKRYSYELSKLDAAQLQQLESLVTRMARSGARRPFSWAWSEFREGIPQWARFMILKGMYLSASDVAGNTAAATEFLSGSSSIYSKMAETIGKENLEQFLISYSKGMLYTLLDLFDEGNTDYESNDSWHLVTYDRGTGASGNPISGLHEDFPEFEQELNITR